MSTTTSGNLKLTKPAYSDPADINVINADLDAIDTAVSAVQDSISSQVKLTTINQSTVAKNATSYAGEIPAYARGAAYRVCLIVGCAGLSATDAYLYIAVFRYSTQSVFLREVLSAGNRTATCSIEDNDLVIAFSSIAYGSCSFIFL